MAIVHRRVFVAKVGAADSVVEVIRNMEPEFRRSGLTAKMRLLTDYNSGRTDRVVWEWESPSLAQLESEMGKSLADPKFKPEFDRWFAKLADLIHYAEVEHFNVVA